MERLIAPALKRGATVITDRFVDSTRVYQGATRGDLGALVEELHRLTIALAPDLTFIIDIDPSVALARARSRGGGETRFEEFGLPFQTRLRAGFLALEKAEPERCRLIDGRGDMREVFARIEGALAGAMA